MEKWWEAVTVTVKGFSCVSRFKAILKKAKKLTNKAIIFKDHLFARIISTNKKKNDISKRK